MLISLLWFLVGDWKFGCRCEEGRQLVKGVLDLIVICQPMTTRS